MGEPDFSMGNESEVLVGIPIPLPTSHMKLPTPILPRQKHYEAISAFDRAVLREIGIKPGGYSSW